MNNTLNVVSITVCSITCGRLDRISSAHHTVRLHTVESRIANCSIKLTCNSITLKITTKEDEEILQKDINEMLKWADKWQLEFHLISV